MSGGLISVHDSRELQAVVLAIKAANRGIRREINKRTRDELNPMWKSVVQAGATDHFTARLLTGVRVAGGNPARALAAQSRAGVGKGKRLLPTRDYYLAEFGVDRSKRTTYQRKNRTGSGTHKVTRRVNVGKPRRIPQGRVVYPAFAQIGPRMVSLWVQTVVRTYHDAAEGKVSL